MKIYYQDNVVQAALKRTRYIYEHFGDKTYINFSGGKDSTVCLELAHIVAEEMGLLPVNVIWLDQEAEWDTTVDYVKKVFSFPWVKPYWIQAPFILDHSLNGKEDGLHCWTGNTMREREQNSIHDIRGYKNLVFTEMLDKVGVTLFPGGCTIYGLRCDESPSRKWALTNTKKVFIGPEVWGAGSSDEKNARAAVIYDWIISDVWKFIHERNLEYNKLYDYQYAHGIPVPAMRVSALVHETALRSLDHAQEFESNMWNRLTDRIEGINTYKHCPEAYNCPLVLPKMFKSWREYRDFLLDKLITNEAHYKIMKDRFDRDDKVNSFLPEERANRCVRVHIGVVLKDDYCLTHLRNFAAASLEWNKVLKEKTGGVI